MSVNKILVNNNDSNYTHSIFDISEYTGNSYLTLSDALDAIPQAKCKGGMTVRYIDSNDKYVQFFCKSQSFTTNRIDWEKVNLKEEIGDLQALTTPFKNNIVDATNYNSKNNLHPKDYSTPVTDYSQYNITHQYISVNGNVKSNSATDLTGYIPVSAYDGFHYKGKGNGCLVAGYSDNEGIGFVPILKSPNSSTVIEYDGLVTIPFGVNYVRVWSYNQTIPAYSATLLFEKFTQTEGNAKHYIKGLINPDYIKDSLGDAYLYKDEYTPGGTDYSQYNITHEYLKVSGSKLANTTCDLTGYIEVAEKDRFQYKGKGNGCLVAGYSDNEGNGYVALLRSPDNSTIIEYDGNIIIPSGVNYIRAWSYNQTSPLYPATLVLRALILNEGNAEPYVKNLINPDYIKDSLGDIYLYKDYYTPGTDYSQYSITHQYISLNGNVESADVTDLTGYIAVSESDIFYYKGKGNGTLVAGYSDNAASGFVQLLKSPTGSTVIEYDGNIVIPSGVNYIRAWSFNQTSESYPATLEIQKLIVNYGNAKNYILSVIGSSEKKKVKIAFVGDSLTQGSTGVVDNRNTFAEKPYPIIFKEFLANSGFDITVLNFGRVGLSPQSYWSNAIPVNGSSHRPASGNPGDTIYFDNTIDVVIIMLGTNGHLETNTIEEDTTITEGQTYLDYADTQCGDYCKIIEYIMEHTQNHAQIILVAPLYSPNRATKLINTLPTIKALGERYQIPVINALYESGLGLFNKSVFFVSDELHLNQNGYKKFGTFMASKFVSLYSTLNP